MAGACTWARTELHQGVHGDFGYFMGISDFLGILWDIYILYIDTIVEYIIWFLFSILNPLQLELNMVGSLL